MTSLLLIGRRREIVDEVADRLREDGHEVTVATSLGEVTGAGPAGYDLAVMGAGLDLDIRLAVVAHLLRNSPSTSIHLKDAASGPSGLLPFARSVLQTRPPDQAAPAG